MDCQHLVEKEKQALAYVREGKMAEAVPLLEEIVNEHPDWEHGGAYYNLACCYEEVERLEDARQAYLAALKFEPENIYFLCGYASFLYLHGTTEEAYGAYCAVIKTGGGGIDSPDECPSILRQLGQQLGLTEEAIASDIEKLCGGS